MKSSPISKLEDFKPVNYNQNKPKLTKMINKHNIIDTTEGENLIFWLNIDSQLNYFVIFNNRLPVKYSKSLKNINERFKILWKKWQFKIQQEFKYIFKVPQ